MKEGEYLADVREPSWPSRRAIMEASRCLYCHDAPCSQACPAGVDVAEFIHRIRSRNYRGAARVIAESNVLGGTCGQVCPVEELCEKACSRTELEEPIKIGALQRFAWVWGWGEAIYSMASEREGDAVAIIGAGPAGLAAAAALARLGHRAVIFEADESPGGLLRWGIPLHRLSEGVVHGEIEAIRRSGVEIRCGIALGRDLTTSDLLGEGFRAIFVGVGLSEPSILQIPGHDLPRVYQATDLFRRLRTGEQLDLGQRVAVIGGGNVALDAALSARRLGARKVEVICLEAPEEMPAFWPEVELAWQEGVEFHTRSTPLRITGSGVVQGVEGVGIEWREPGNFTPTNAIPIRGTWFGLRVNAVIEAIGQRLDQRVAEALDVEVDERGLIRVDEGGQTSNRMIFAGGDCVNGGATVVQAVADGKRGARGIDEWLRR